MSDPLWGVDALTLAGRLLGVLDRVAVAKRPCKLCGADLYALQVYDQPQPVWYSKHGVPHLIDCPKLKERAPLARSQAQLFDKRPVPE